MLNGSLVGGLHLSRELFEGPFSQEFGQRGARFSGRLELFEAKAQDIFQQSFAVDVFLERFLSFDQVGLVSVDVSGRDHFVEQLVLGHFLGRLQFFNRHANISQCVGQEGLVLFIVVEIMMATESKGSFFHGGRVCGFMGGGESSLQVVSVDAKLGSYQLI